MSRVFWFFLGGATAALWAGRQEQKYDAQQAQKRQSSCQCSAGHGHGFQAEQSVPSGPSNSSDAQVVQRGRTLDRQWGANREQLVDAMADMSEATLNSITTAVEQLKLKLAEHRAEREKFVQAQANLRESRGRSRSQSSPASAFIEVKVE